MIATVLMHVFVQIKKEKRLVLSALAAAMVYSTVLAYIWDGIFSTENLPLVLTSHGNWVPALLSIDTDMALIFVLMVLLVEVDLITSMKKA